MKDIPEPDWKLLRELKPRALERLCERILAHVQVNCDVGGETSYQRFLKIFADIQEGNAEIARIFDDLRRSNALRRIALLRAEGLISASEFSRFSDTTRSAAESSVKGFIVISKFANSGGIR
jgi:hypothetical protein